jgi:hypothetical protein
MRTTSVYRLYDRYGILLYVGVTSRNLTRQHEHAAGKAWWEHVYAQTFEHMPDRDTALDVEAKAIGRELPVFNVVGAVGHAERRAMYEAGQYDLLLRAQQSAAQPWSKKSSRFLATASQRKELTERTLIQAQQLPPEPPPRKEPKPWPACPQPGDDELLEELRAGRITLDDHEVSKIAVAFKLDSYEDVLAALLDGRVPLGPAMRRHWRQRVNARRAALTAPTKPDPVLELQRWYARVTSGVA